MAKKSRSEFLGFGNEFLEEMLKSGASKFHKQVAWARHPSQHRVIVRIFRIEIDPAQRSAFEAGFQHLSVDALKQSPHSSLRLTRSRSWPTSMPPNQSSPLPTMSAASFDFSWIIRSIRSSTEPLVMNLCTSTRLVWPMR
jgi:hypothetical protein